ncbi:ankyrin repeat-containing domain protein [Dactylonectria estremocensis]|uniref:Ankyrin repeat-containing domain protein n=1 Tax=Dactylonectria estremocensis TaxID=1079267 RepID=A0A9P9D6U4_9HYPO|nr:ankyrin repeat-containing domain protein [Dactylonectria estremocensis]
MRLYSYIRFKATTTVGWRPRATRTELLDYLSRNSDALQDLLVSVRHRLHNVSVVSFYETQATAPLSFLIVDRASAQLGLSNEDPIPLYEDHRSICRFASETSSSYMAVAKALRRIVRQSPGVSLALRRASTPSSYRTLSDVEITCMTLLNDSDAAKHAELPPKPIPGTCQWIRRHHLFVSWLEKGSNALLWLTGNPGCGKTMLSYSLAQNFKEVRARSRTTDGRAVLIGLIFQIIERHRSMIRHVRRSFSSLWGIFLRIVKDPKAGSLYVILDALDECEKVSCHQLLESISDMLADSFHTMRSGTTSYANTKQTLQPQISIDDGQIGYVDDLQKFIRERVDDISLNRQYSSDVREFLFQAMISKADRTFLWTHVVLASVEKSLLTSRKDFQNIIASIPEDLANTYKRYLAAIPSGHQDDASHLLKLLLASSRPLHLDELNIAFTMDPSHVTTEDVTRDTQNAIAHTVQGILGPLVRVSGPQVSLVHQSVKEFLLEQVAGKYESFPAMHTVNAQSSALRLATNDRFSTNTSSAESDFQMPGLLDELPMGDFTRDFWDEEDHNLNSDVLFREEELDPEICLSLTSNYGFYSYASLHWAEHFAICEESASDQLRNAARSLLDVTTGSCRNWLHFYRTQAVTSIDDSLVDQNPIILAAQFNLHTMLKDLLGSCDHAQAIKNRSLYWASQLGHDRIVASLLIAGAEPDSAELERQTALTTASENGNLTCVVTLLADERTNINIAGRRGRSALSFACGSGHDNIVKELLGRSSCNADDSDNSGGTPFLWAVGGGHHSIISSLARHPNVDINHRDKTGRTAVSWAAGDGMDATLKQLLKLPGINVNIKDNNGKSPLSWAAGNGCANAAEVLLKSTLRNAISWASGGGNHDTLIKLLDEGCPGVDTEDIDGWTPLAWAIQTDSPKTVQALINTKSAVEYGHASIVKAKSKRGSTPISIAEQFERNDLLSELITHKS